MLGDKIGGASGKVTSQRVIAKPGRRSKHGDFVSVERNAARHRCNGNGHVLVRPDETLYGEGQGVVMAKDGKMATWIGQGVGTMKKDGTTSYRGAVYYQTSSQKWSRLNKVAAVFEYEVDMQGNSRSELWEWK